MAMVTLRARLQTWLSRAQRIARKGCTARRRESGRSATGVAEGLAMLLMRLAVRLQLLESGRRDRHDPGFLVFVPRGKKTAYNLRTRFIRHLSNATLTPGGPAPRIVHRRILKKKGAVPQNRKRTAPNCCESSWCWTDRCHCDGDDSKNFNLGSSCASVDRALIGFWREKVIKRTNASGGARFANIDRPP